MSQTDRRFWPFKPKTSIISAIFLLLILLGIVAVLRNTINWPGQNSENVILIGVLIVSLLPILLSILDVLMDKGATIGYGDFKIDFSKVQYSGVSGISIPVNIGVPGMPVTDSDTQQILDSLKKATTNDIIIIDLEEGQAWWETRLLVLVSGAARLGRPHKIVFVGTDAKKAHTYQGWGYPTDLLRCLLNFDTLYQRYFLMARAAAGQWGLVEPLSPIPPQINSPVPAMPVNISGFLATAHQWMAFDHATGLPNELLAEQLLQSIMGQKIEKEKGPAKVNISRLHEVFRSVLNKDVIDQKKSMEEQLRSFFESESEYIGITDHSKYIALVSRATIFNEMLAKMLNVKQDKK